MSDVTVTINRRTYQIACDDGQEDHLRRLAGIVDKRVEELVSAMGQIGDQRLLVMAALLLADEVADVRGEVEQLEARIRTMDSTPDEDRKAVGDLNALATRIEAIAEALEAA